MPNKQKPGPPPVVRVRDARTGQFVPDGTQKRHPATTIVDKMPRKRK